MCYVGILTVMGGNRLCQLVSPRLGQSVDQSGPSGGLCVVPPPAEHGTPAHDSVARIVLVDGA